MKVVNALHWNTGNLYTVFGQRIGALVINDGAIVFCDLDRGISGYIPATFMPDAAIRERVKRGYMYTECEYWIFPPSVPYDLRQQLLKKALVESQRADPITKRIV